MAHNMFANIKTLEQLDFAYDMATSPENVSHDGERSQASTRAAYARIAEQFTERRNQIVLEG